MTDIQDSIEKSKIPGDDPVWDAIRSNHTIISNCIDDNQALRDTISQCEIDLKIRMQKWISDEMNDCQESRASTVAEIRTQTKKAAEMANNMQKVMNENEWIINAMSWAVRNKKYSVPLYIFVHAGIYKFLTSNTLYEIFKDFLTYFLGKL